MVSSTSAFVCEHDIAHLDLTRLPSISVTVRNHHLAANKKLGQHFLLDPNILQRIAEAPGAIDGQHVLEIGPGPGGLTRALLGAGGLVTAVERDPRCIRALQPLKDMAGERLELIEADVLSLDFSTLIGGRSFKAVANLPYNIGTEILVRWLLMPDPFESIHVLLQREVVDRLVAVPSTKAYGRLSVLAQLLCRVERDFDLPAGAFHPPPKVTSSLVSLWPKEDRPRGRVLEKLQMLTSLSFQQRRKMLRRSLAPLGDVAPLLLERAGISPEKRPDALSVDSFLQLAQEANDMSA